MICKFKTRFFKYKDLNTWSNVKHFCLELFLHKGRTNRFYRPTLWIYPMLGLSPDDSFMKRTDWIGCRFTHTLMNSEHANRDNGSDQLITHRFQSACTCHVKSLYITKSTETYRWERHTQFPWKSPWGHAANRWFAHKFQYSRAFSLSLRPFSQIDHCTSQTKKVSKLQGLSFHLSPLPSLFQSSRQCSSSPFSYLE